MKSHCRNALLGSVLLALVAGGFAAIAADIPGSISLKSTRSDILVNESSLVTLTSGDPLGPNPTVTWSTTLGKITPLKQGDKDYRSDAPAAMFTSEKAGKATVTAALLKGDGNTASESVQITVNPLRAP